jgi:hypothetical protein
MGRGHCVQRAGLSSRMLLSVTVHWCMLRWILMYLCRLAAVLCVQRAGLSSRMILSVTVHWCMLRWILVYLCRLAAVLY